MAAWLAEELLPGLLGGMAREQVFEAGWLVGARMANVHGGVLLHACDAGYGLGILPVLLLAGQGAPGLGRRAGRAGRQAGRAGRQAGRARRQADRHAVERCTQADL